MEKTYNPGAIEDKWYTYWLEKDFFSSRPNPNKEPYTIVIPPPNVTGILHMGHMLNNTLQDVLIRRARMKGKEACWVPGTDHASIATEAKVVKMLEEQGIRKKDLTREVFLEHAWAWKEKYGGIILEQLKKIGASCDWKRTRFTMEDDLSSQVIRVFVTLYRKGYIYRGVRMVNWDPQGKTALSDEEVNYKEVQSKLYHVRYDVVGSSDAIVIATTRPETILGDTAICVNPNDERYQHLIGKKAIVPMVGREVPIIADEYVDPAFGTGCLKVTPAHDLNDYELGMKHRLEVIDILNPDGTLSDAAVFYVGTDRFEARKAIVKDLDAQGRLVKTEDIRNNVGFSERTQAVIEPRISTQWFLKMEELAQPALENVMNDNIRLIPPKFKNMYKHWMENVKDWCISRQLWWGHRIPAYFLPDGNFVVAETLEEALALAQEQIPGITAEALRQDEDVLDTWFSSWLWPFSVFNGLNEPENEDIKYYYPTNDLVTAPEILFFWVARMIIAGYAFMGEKPFNNVYLNGIVRDKLGRKMSKQFNNSPDLLALIDEHGADGVRMGMLMAAPAGNDLLFDVELCKQGWNFANKIWNAFRLVKGWEVASGTTEVQNQASIAWYEARFQEVLAETEDHFDKYRLADAMLSIYKLIWDDFCANYLEMVKPDYQQPIDQATYQATLGFFERNLQLLHPFMPFLSEELWHQLREREPLDCITVSAYPEVKPYDPAILAQAANVFALVGFVRNVRNEKQIPRNKPLTVSVRTDNPESYTAFGRAIQKLAAIGEIQFTKTPIEGAAQSVWKNDEFFILLEGEIDPVKERERILRELEYTKGFLASVEKKLANERFVSTAPAAVVEKERLKQADAESKITLLEAALKALPS